MLYSTIVYKSQEWCCVNIWIRFWVTYYYQQVKHCMKKQKLNILSNESYRLYSRLFSIVPIEFGAKAKVKKKQQKFIISDWYFIHSFWFQAEDILIGSNKYITCIVACSLHIVLIKSLKLGDKFIEFLFAASLICQFIAISSKKVHHNTSLKKKQFSSANVFVSKQNTYMKDMGPSKKWSSLQNW